VRVQLSVRAFTLTCGFFLGGTVAVVGGVSMFVPGYGQPVLDLFASLYPFYSADGTPTDWIVGVILGVIDGLAGGFVFAWLYNLLRNRES
jgi:hypothetical protein